MDLTDFWKLRRIYEERARERAPEYMNSASADMTWGERVVTEMLIDFATRLEKFEALLSPEAEGIPAETKAEPMTAAESSVPPNKSKFY